MPTKTVRPLEKRQKGDWNRCAVGEEILPDSRKYHDQRRPSSMWMVDDDLHALNVPWSTPVRSRWKGKDIG